MFHSMLIKCKMAAVNTFFDSGCTFFGQWGSTRIDYVCLPQSLANHWKSSQTWRKASRAVQATVHTIDHVPLVVKTALPLPFQD